MENKEKVKIEVQMFPKASDVSNKENPYRIFNASPISTTSKLKLNNRFQFSIKGELPFLEVGETYELGLKEVETTKWSTTYEVLEVYNFIELGELSREESENILSKMASANNIKTLLDVYPDFINKILTEGKEAIDTSLLYNIKDSKLNSYERQLNEKFKYYHIMQSFKSYKIDINECKLLCDKYKTTDKIEDALSENPYEVLIDCLNRPFLKEDFKGRECGVDHLLVTNWGKALRPDLEESEVRCEYMMLEVLRRNEVGDGGVFKGGSTRLESATLISYCEDYAPELVPMMMKVAKDCGGIHYDDETQDVARITTYLKELKIAEFVQTLLTNPIDKDWDWSQFKDIKDGKLTEEQSELLKSTCNNRLVMLDAGAGCVDGDTEFFNGKEWKKIRDYQHGDKVGWGTFDFDEFDEYMYPTQLEDNVTYIKEPCDKMYRIVNEKYNIDQVYSDEHRIFYFKDEFQIELCETTMYELRKDTRKFKGTFAIQEYWEDEGANHFEDLIIEEFIPEDGFKYCFKVPSGSLILRRNGVAFLTGNCGKSSAMMAVLDMLDAYNCTYTTMTATGKSAKRLAEQTNRPCSTIHKVKMKDGGTKATYVIVDEDSFLSVELMDMVIGCVKNEEDIRVILSGDHMQLPSISCGRIVRDLLDCGKIPTVNLTKCFRFGEGGKATVSTKCRNGEFYIEPEDEDKDRVTYGENGDYTYVAFDGTISQIIDEYEYVLNKHKCKPEDIWLLTPWNVRERGSINLNNHIQALVNPPKKGEKVIQIKAGDNTIAFRKGDIVMNTVNNYECMSEDVYNQIKKDDNLSALDFQDEMCECMNGEVGKVVEVLDDVLKILFDNEILVFNKKECRNLLLGYSINVFKSQGSQNKHIILLTLSEHQRSLNRQLLYTGQTRASDTITEIGDIKAMKKSVNTLGDDSRRTFLIDMLKRMDV